MANKAKLFDKNPRYKKKIRILKDDKVGKDMRKEGWEPKYPLMMVRS